MGTAIKHLFLCQTIISKFLTSRHSDAQSWASECLDVKNCKWRLYSVCHWVLYSCTHLATVGVKGLKSTSNNEWT